MMFWLRSKTAVGVAVGMEPRMRGLGRAWADVEWAGVPFLSLFHHDARMLRVPGLFAFVHRDEDAHRTLLFVGHGDSLATNATSAHPTWTLALGLGMNEVHVNLQAQERVDRLQLCAHIVRRRSPLLNLLEAASSPDAATSVVWGETGSAATSAA